MQFLRDIMVKADIVVTRNISLIYLNFTDKISSIFQVMNLNQSMGTSKHSKIKKRDATVMLRLSFNLKKV